MSDSTIPQSDVIMVELQDHVATVWLDRPDKLNAMAAEFWVEFPETIETLSRNDAVRAIVIAGRGKAFTVGIDVAELAAGGSVGASSDVEARLELYRRIKRMQHTFSSLAECSKPVIVAIHGWCLGAGIDLITAADIRLASADAVFSVRETRMALVADVGTLQRLPRIIDPGRVAELVYTGKDFGADEAAEMGLVTRVLPDRESVVKEALELAAEIAANSPLVVQAAKEVLRNTAGRSVDEQLDYIALWNAAFLHSEDLGEAVRSFMEKRPPQWKGR